MEVPGGFAPSTTPSTPPFARTPHCTGGQDHSDQGDHPALHPPGCGRGPGAGGAGGGQEPAPGARGVPPGAAGMGRASEGEAMQAGVRARGGRVLLLRRGVEASQGSDEGQWQALQRLQRIPPSRGSYCVLPEGLMLHGCQGANPMTQRSAPPFMHFPRTSKHCQVAIHSPCHYPAMDPLHAPALRAPALHAQDMNAMIDAAKYADLVLLMVDGGFGFEMETFEFLNICQVRA